MRLPRDISSTELIKLLQKFGYQISRQKGSHIRLTMYQQGAHHITVPNQKKWQMKFFNHQFKDAIFSK